jgi:NitT/TauT family transport system substrate-binding protein
MPTQPTAASVAPTPDPSRRRLLQAAGAGAAILGAPRLARAQGAPKIRVGFWPIASGLPFYVAVEKGFF